MVIRVYVTLICKRHGRDDHFKGSPFLLGFPYTVLRCTDLHIKKEILYRMIIGTNRVSLAPMKMVQLGLYAKELLH